MVSIYIIGHKGWIGSMYINIFKKENIKYYYSNYRGESDELKNDILRTKPSHVLCCIGRTNGKRDNKIFNSIDYLESNDVLKENINDNLYVPLSLAIFCDKNNIHFTYIGTGCIYNYDENHKINGNGFKENEIPNFHGSNYSIVKGFTNNLIQQTNALHLRIRMPISLDNSPRCFINKILQYKKICSNENSMSVLDTLLPISIEMMRTRKKGTFNFTNPGTISHNTILTLYKDMINHNFTWENFDLYEQDKILESKRSNNYLDTTKIEEYYNLPHIYDDIKRVLIEKFK